MNIYLSHDEIPNLYSNCYNDNIIRKALQSMHTCFTFFP